MGFPVRSIVATFSEKFAAVREVPIKDCVHYCAYRYGRGESNPYEQYAIGLAAGLPLDEIRAEFVDAISRYRPRNLGQAIGVMLSRPYPLWWLPWRTPKQVNGSPGWVATAEGVVDVMTHFSDYGVPRKLLEMEFRWHETAFTDMSTNGYLPDHYSYITARELCAENSSYLLIDGNHRLSSLSALGIDTVRIKIPRATKVMRENADEWPLVRAKMMTLDDALSVFDAYHKGNRKPMSAEPAPIVD